MWIFSVLCSMTLKYLCVCACMCMCACMFKILGFYGIFCEQHFSLNLHLFKWINTILVISFNYWRVFSFLNQWQANEQFSSLIFYCIEGTTTIILVQNWSILSLSPLVLVCLWLWSSLPTNPYFRRYTWESREAGAAGAESPFLCQFREIPGLVVSGIMQVVNGTEMSAGRCGIEVVPEALPTGESSLVIFLGWHVNIFL